MPNMRATSARPASRLRCWPTSSTISPGCATGATPRGRPTSISRALLESCVLRVKAQAGAARVLVRSAISERLPRIRADRASLGQALLNLLASAIDQTPIGGSVILSAQAEEDGAIAIHVRDGAESSTDLGERFVVFRDGVDKDGEQLGPVPSSVGLALTRSLLAVNACSLSVDPTAGIGTLFSLLIPADLGWWSRLKARPPHWQRCRSPLQFRRNVPLSRDNPDFAVSGLGHGRPTPALST